jgi:uncharacterized protein
MGLPPRPCGVMTARPPKSYKLNLCLLGLAVTSQVFCSDAFQANYAEVYSRIFQQPGDTHRRSVIIISSNVLAKPKDSLTDFQIGNLFSGPGLLTGGSTSTQVGRLFHLIFPLPGFRKETAIYPRIILTQNVKDQYFFTVRASNEQLLLTSPFYTVKGTAMSRISSIRHLGRRERNTQICYGREGQSFFVLMSNKGETLGSSALYTDFGALEKDLDAFRKCIRGTRVVDLTLPGKAISASKKFHSPWIIRKSTELPAHIVLTQNVMGQYSFTFRASDGQLLLTSPCLPDKDTAIYRIDVTRKLALMTWCYQVRSAGGGQYYFELKNDKGEMIGRSTVYPNERSLQKGIDILKNCAKPGRLLDLTVG